MKIVVKYIHLILVCCLITSLFFSCNAEDANDCFQTEGSRIQEEITLASFNKIRLEDGVSMTIKQGDVQKVVLETGENLRSDVVVNVEDDGTLVARDTNGCNLIRDYNVTHITVTSPNIVDIINGSSFDIRSEGVLNYPNLRLRSLVIIGFDLKKNGNFYLDLDTESLQIIANGSSVFYLDGQAEDLRVVFSDEIPRLEARDFIVQNAEIRHVSANEIHVNPQQSLKADLSSSGNLFSYNRPATIEITELYRGRVIFVD